MALAQTNLPAGAQIWLGSVLPVYQATPGTVATVNSGVTLQITGVRFDSDAYAELGPTYRHEEHYNLACSLCAWSGDGSATGYAKTLQDVYAMYADLSIAISSNPTLGLTTPAPRLAWPRQLDLKIGPDPFGRPSSCIDFEVQVQARVTSLS